MPGTHRLRVVIFDLDGVVYRGDRPVPGARELIDRLHGADVLVRFATNNSTVTRSEYVERLARMGIVASPEEIATSSWATVEYLQASELVTRTVITVGEGGMVEELRSAGYTVTRAADATPADLSGSSLDESFDACVVGLDREFDYRRLAAAVAAVRGGARLIATNADTVYPTADGSLPGAGAMVAAIAAASAATPIVIGKPQPALFNGILAAADVPPAQSVVIGDNPDSDIVAAQRAGIRSILVLTGVADRATADALTGEHRPDHIAADPDAVWDLVSPWIVA